MLSGRRSPRLPHNFITPEGNAMSTDTPFMRGFLGALIFTERCSSVTMSEWHDSLVIGAGLSDGAIPSDACTEHLDPGDVARIAEAVAKWQADNALLLAIAYHRGYTEERAGHDLWLTAHGHGAGFWDREELREDALGDALTTKAHDFQQCEVYVRQHDAGIEQQELVIGIDQWM